MRKFLSIISFIISKYFLQKLVSINTLIFLKLRGLKGGYGLRAHSNVKFRGWINEISMGKNVVLHSGVNIVVARNSKLIFKDKAWISYNSIIIASTGTVTSIGKNTMFGGNCTIVSADHDINDRPSLRDSAHKIGNIIIGDNCWIGANCVITKGVKIGEGSIIGACSVVTNDIPPYSIAVGTPARVIKQRILKNN